MFNLTNLLNHVAPAVYRIDDANVSNLILMIIALCNNWNAAVW